MKSVYWVPIVAVVQYISSVLGVMAGMVLALGRENGFHQFARFVSIDRRSAFDDGGGFFLIWTCGTCMVAFIGFYVAWKLRWRIRWFLAAEVQVLAAVMWYTICYIADGLGSC